MSKPVARVVLSVLIVLVLVIGIYMTVYGAALSVGASSGRVQVTAGLLPDLNHQRMQQASAPASGFYTGLEAQQSYQDRGHGCGADYSAMDD
jgi:hypothetical protein